MLRKFSVQSMHYTHENKEKRKILRNNLIFCTSSCVQSYSKIDDSRGIVVYNSVVESLLKRPFRLMREDEKQKVIKNGRPCPSFRVQLSDNLDNSQTYSIGEELYKTIPWLCGCEQVKRLFCWPCMLFSTEANDWNSFGYDDFDNLIPSAKRHEELFTHLLSMKELIVFGKKKYIDIIMNDEYKSIVKKHNVIVEQNRKVLNHLIMIVSILGSLGNSWALCQSRDAPGRPEAHGAVQVDNPNYYKLIGFLKNYNSDFYTNVKSSKNVINIFSPNLYTDLMVSISEVLLQNIKTDLTKTKYVTLMLNEVSNMSIKCHIATSLRYINEDGDVVERFVDFTVIDKERTSAVLLAHILKVVDEYEIGAKLIAYTYDGALLRIEEHNRLCTKLQEKCAWANFINGYSNNIKTAGYNSSNFNSILIQSISSIDQVRIFFSLLKSVKQFFVTSGKCLEEFNPALFVNMAAASSRTYETDASFIQAFYDNRTKIELTLLALLSKPLYWDLNTLSSSYNVVTSITKFDFVFFLEIFYLVLPATQKLFEIMQCNVLHDPVFIQNKIMELRTLLDRLRHDFCSIWRTVYDKYQVTNECLFNRFFVMNSRRNKVESNNDYYQRYYICENRQTYKIIFYEIIDKIKLNITVRFNDISILGFLELLDPMKFPKHRTAFPENAFMSLKNNYASQFDYYALKNELFVLYNDKYMNKNLNPLKLHSYIKKLDLNPFLPETSKLCELVITMPIMSIAADNDIKYTALDRINSYISQNTHQSNLLQTSTAILYIECFYLESLRRKNKEKFDELVIKTFSIRNNKISLLYKS